MAHKKPKESKMSKSKYDVDVLEQQAIKTRQNVRGQRGIRPWDGTMTVERLRTYCDKVLFLCREIKKLKESK